jgi:hypothetical protein
VATLGSAESVGFEVDLERGPTLSGRAIDADGRAVAGAHVRLVLSHPTGCSWPHAFGVTHRCGWPPPVVTDSEGRFEWLSFPADVAARWPGSHFVLLLEGDAFETALVHRVETRSPDADGVIGIDVVLRRGQELRGRVLGPDGAPVAGATVSATAEAVTGQPVCVRLVRHATTDAAGRFRLDHVPEGEIVVSCGDVRAPLRTAHGRSLEARLTLP